MPTRMLREGILESERVDKLSAEAEVFYRRLMSIVDDYARYYANPALLISGCFPLRVASARAIRPEIINQWLKDIEDAWLLVTYDVGGTRYLQLLDFRQQKRAKKSKFPHPPADAMHLIHERSSSVHLGEGEDGGEGVVENEVEGAARATRLPADWVLPKGWGEWALAEQPTWDEKHVRFVAAQFRDHFFGVGGAAGLKRDWPATWRKWVRKEGPRKGGTLAAVAQRWKPGAEPNDVLVRVAREMQLEPWAEGETFGQFRARIVDAGGEDLLKPGKAA